MDAGLIFIGDGPSRARIEKKLAGCGLASPGDAVFPGAIGSPDTLGVWLGASDVHVQPGAVGLAVVDAAFGGLPTFIAAPGPNGPFHGPEWNFILQGETGWVLTENTDEAFATAVTDFLGMSETERRDASNRCAEYARRHLGIDRMVDGMMETIELVLGARPRRNPRSKPFRGEFLAPSIVTKHPPKEHEIRR